MRKKKRGSGKRNLLLILCFVALCVTGILWVSNDEVLPIVPPEPAPAPTLAATPEANPESSDSRPAVTAARKVESAGAPVPPMPKAFSSREERLVPIEDTLRNNFFAYPMLYYTDRDSFDHRYDGMREDDPAHWSNTGETLYTEDSIWDGSIPNTIDQVWLDSWNQRNAAYWLYLYESRYLGEEQAAMRHFLDDVERDVLKMADPEHIKPRHSSGWLSTQPEWEHAFELIATSSRETLDAALARLRAIRTRIPSPATPLRRIFINFDANDGESAAAAASGDPVDGSIGERIYSFYGRAKRARQWRNHHDYVREHFDEYLSYMNLPWLEYEHRGLERMEFESSASRIGVDPVFRSVRLKFAETERWLAALETMIGLGLYHRTHGVYPEHLNALVPNYLDALPRDPTITMNAMTAQMLAEGKGTAGFPSSPAEGYSAGYGGGNPVNFAGEAFAYRREAGGYALASLYPHPDLLPYYVCKHALFHHSPVLHSNPMGLLREWQRIGPFARREDEPSPNTLLHLHESSRSLEDYAAELGTQAVDVSTDSKAGIVTTGDPAALPREQVYYFLAYAESLQTVEFNADCIAYLWAGANAAEMTASDSTVYYRTRDFPLVNYNGLRSVSHEVESPGPRVPVLVRLNCVNGRNAFSVGFSP